MKTNNDKEAFSRRLNNLLDENNYPAKHEGRQTQLGIDFGVTQKGARKWLEAEAIPRRNKIMEMARRFKVNTVWLEYGEGEKYSKPSDNIDQAGHLKNTEPTDISTKSVLLISWTDINKWQKATVKTKTRMGKDMIPCNSPHSEGAYALRVIGDTMTCNGSDSFPPGVIIVVDPEQTAKDGDFVIASIKGEEQPTFKKLVVDGSRQYLKPLNPQYPTITGNFKVIGRVIEMQKSF